VADIVDYRRPTDEDHETIVRRIDDWAGGRHAKYLVARLWFRQFTSTSWVATREGGKLVGVAIGFVSQDEPSRAILHLVAVDPKWRHRGIGSELVARFSRDVVGRGARTVRTTAWPDDRPTIKFLEAIGFHIVEPPDGQRLYGTPATADYDAPGDDRAELERALDAPAGG
jgi:ribosomal protein S18 acetylase RimI-like enzyme